MKKGLAFHCHHGTLYEFVYDYDERVRYIKEFKPKGEQELRLRLFKLVPLERIPGKDSPEWQACAIAREAYVTAWQAYVTAREAYVTAREAYVTAFGKEIVRLHKELCPNCPWDGHTIFKGAKKWNLNNTKLN